MKTAGRTLDTSRPTMWLGTADGSIFIFPTTDDIKSTRQRQKIKVLSSVNSILHLDVRIFVACQNGNLFVYSQNNDGIWNIDAPITVHIKSDRAEVVEIRRMLAVAGNIWCAAHRFIYVLNSVTLNVELSFPLNGSQADPRGIDFMAYGNQTVWLATDNSSLVSLYHATTGEFLMETDLKPVVRRSLIHCDEVIKWHKEVCLRITCMTVCKDQLWVGTSAGIIVTITIPRVGLSSTQASRKPPQVEANMTALSLGHIGNVRFFVTLESPNTNPLLGINNIAENAQNSALSSTKTNSIEKTNIYVSSCSDSTVNWSAKSSSIRVTPSGELVGSEAPCPPCSPTATTTNGEQECSRSPSLASPTNTQPSLGRRGASKTSTFQTQISTSPAQGYGHARHHLLGVRRPSMNPCTTFGSPMQVISGGDGLEKFTSPGSGQGNAGYLASEDAMSAFTTDGQCDNKNFLLIWEVQ